jgi:hypothetical protein
VSWQQALASWGLAFGFACIFIGCVKHKKRNRRTGLPAPRPDERSSLEQFKRIHQP